MTKSGLTGPRLLALFFAGGLLFNYPLLYLFNRDSAVFGVPLVFVYVFAVWAALIAAAALIVSRRSG